MSAAIRIPRGTFHVSINELRRRLQNGELQVGQNGLETERNEGTRSTNQQRENQESRRETQQSVKVPRGTFHANINDLRQQLLNGKLEPGSNGLQLATRQDIPVPANRQPLTPTGFEETSPMSHDEARDRPSVMVPKGTFHGFFSSITRNFEGAGKNDDDPISSFAQHAPNATYGGKIGGEHVWTEWIQDPVTGARIQLAYTSSDGGHTAESWCIEPNMQNHSEDQHKCHCYHDGRICTDLHGVKRNLIEKRARSIIWVTGFCQYLLTGNFLVDEV